MARPAQTSHTPQHGEIVRARSGLAKAAGAVRPAAGYHQLRSCGKPPVGASHVEQARKAARRVNQGMKNSEARLEAERNGARRSRATFPEDWVWGVRRGPDLTFKPIERDTTTTGCWLEKREETRSNELRQIRSRPGPVASGPDPGAPELGPGGPGPDPGAPVAVLSCLCPPEAHPATNSVALGSMQIIFTDHLPGPLNAMFGS